MAQWLRMLNYSSRGPKFNFSSHLVAHNHLQFQFQLIQYSFLASVGTIHATQIYMQEKHLNTLSYHFHPTTMSNVKKSSQFLSTDGGAEKLEPSCIKQKTVCFYTFSLSHTHRQAGRHARAHIHTHTHNSMIHNNKKTETQ